MTIEFEFWIPFLDTLKLQKIIQYLCFALEREKRNTLQMFFEVCLQFLQTKILAYSVITEILTLAENFTMI